MNFLFYLLQVHIALSLLYAVYKAIATRNTHLTARRALLLGIMLFAVTYPLLRIPGMEGAIPATLHIVLPELPITPAAPAQTPVALDPYRLAAWFYGGMALLLGLRMTVRLLSIVGLRRSGTLSRHEGYRVVICPGDVQPCSFFNWIFLPASAAANPTAWAQVLKHEKAHVRQMHSLDILLAEGVAALCWINPVAWLLLKEVRLNLEYLADRAALRGESEKKPYQYLLLDLARATRPHTSTLPFNHSFLKERIAMINRRASSPRSRYRYLLALPVGFLLVVGSQSCRQSPAPEDTSALPATAATAEAQPQTATLHEESGQEPVFEVAEVMPEFPGGNQALFEFIAENLQYPQEAIDNQTEGRVVLQFVVDKRGKVSDIKILQNATPALDQAAIDVVRALPDWKPGMQSGEPVNVRYALPIAFKLS